MDEPRYREAERALWRSVGVLPSEQMLALAGTGASVRVQEVGAGEPVVFVHGASNAGTSWASLAARLSGFRCILVDRPGCGLSPPADPNGGRPDMARLGAFADALLVDVLDALGIERAHLVGTSFGGYFALRAAAAHPQRIDHVVVLGWTFGAPIASTPLVMRIAMQPRLGHLLTRVPPNERMARAMLRQIGLRGAVESGRFGAVELGWFLSLLRDTDTMRNEIAASPRVVSLRGFDRATQLPASLLARVEAPTTFLWGEDDPMGGPDLARRFVSQLPHATLELLPAAGHAPWIDDPDHVAERVEAILRA